MTTRHTLPSGGWVDIKDVEDLRAGDKRKAQRSIAKEDLDHAFNSWIDVTDKVIEIAVTAGVIENVDLSSEGWLDNLTLADLDVLDKLIIPHAQALFPPAVTPDDAKVPDSPTVPESE